jgi:adenine-specific DNA-methyltransferase
MAGAPRRAEDYEHLEARRLNNPPAGLAREDIAPPPTRSFAATPVDADPRVPPELVWWGKAASDAFEVEAPSIHIHEALTTEAILAAARRESAQPTLFADPELDRSAQVAFYEHEGRWRNRLVLGDSLRVMASLLERERLGGQVQMVYIDPPYGINYNSNFQARISQRAPRDGSDEALTREPEQVQAYRDTWEKGVHSYLTYLRERVVAARDLLGDSGSIVVQIGPDNLHLVRLLLDEVFGPTNHCATITVTKTSQVTAALLPEVTDYLLWYARDKAQVQYNQLYEPRTGDLAGGAYQHVEIDGERRRMTADELANPAGVVAKGGRIFRYDNATSQGFSAGKTVDFEYQGRTFHPGSNRHWLLRPEGMQGLAERGRLAVIGNTLSYVRYLTDTGGIRRTNVWTDTGQAGFAQRKKAYVVETNAKIVERCVAMLTQPGDLLFDPTCGSGTSAYVAEKLGRRWITTDTSRVALALARERLLTAKYDWYSLVDEARGVDAGLKYETFEWVTASSIGYDESTKSVPLYDQPLVERSRVRVSGPFTVEALSRYSDNPFLDSQPPTAEAENVTGAQDHVGALLDALRTLGIPRQAQPPANVATLTRTAGGALHAEGTFVNGGGREERFGVSLGPRYGPVTVAQIDEALADAYGYDLIVFAGFAATAEAQEYLRPGKRGRFKVALLEANADLLLADLLRNTKASQTFRLFSAPETKIRREGDGQVVVELLGMDTFDAATGDVTSRSRDEIAAWFVDHAYDGLVFHVNQALFTRTRAWEALGRALNGTVNVDVIDALHSFASLPFQPGETGKVAVRVVDDAGQTSETVLDVPGPGGA